MKRVLVTGCAGFIGSSLSLALLKKGYEVIGIDSFTENYTKWIKNRNMDKLVRYPNFSYIQESLLTSDLQLILKNVNYIFHQAAMPGVRSSWGADFQKYVDYNILATQKLLEAAKHSFIEKLIYASSSSIYGQTNGRVSEDRRPAPFSPYGVTKLAGEHLCQVYHANFGVPAVSLRYFTVYGPGQRPDMAFHKFIRNMLADKEITIYGDGEQTRDYTYIDDAVNANLLAMEKGRPGETYNIGGNSSVKLMDVIHLLAELMQVEPKLKFVPARPGDPKHTWADITKAQRELGYNPTYPLKEGLRKQVAYIESLYNPRGGVT